MAKKLSAREVFWQKRGFTYQGTFRHIPRKKRDKTSGHLIDDIRFIDLLVIGASQFFFSDQKVRGGKPGDVKGNIAPEVKESLVQREDIPNLTYLDEPGL